MDDRTRMALNLIVQDRDQAQLVADNQALGRYRRDDAAAEVRAYNMVLATFAGTLHYYERRRLELALASGTDLELPKAPEPGPDDPTDDPTDEPADPEADRLGRQALATIVGAEYPALTADQATPMGGWEPRS